MNTKLIGDSEIKDRLQEANRLWLFLDYDGTLAEFAPTPDDIIVDKKLISLLDTVRKKSDHRIAIISGRRLKHIQELIPIQGILLAGAYGVEIQDFDGKIIHRFDYNSYRQKINTLKPKLENLLENQESFYLEDKGWSLAIHAKFAEESLSKKIIAQARKLAEESIEFSDFQLLGGHKFLEITPKPADKGKTIQYILREFPFINALPVYIGDDDKDEKAFITIKKNNGIPIIVAKDARETEAKLRFPTPIDVRNWLRSLVN
jgi:trehalose 6-phosphate phosphatase